MDSDHILKLDSSMKRDSSVFSFMKEDFVMIGNPNETEPDHNFKVDSSIERKDSALVGNYMENPTKNLHLYFLP